MSEDREWAAEWVGWRWCEEGGVLERCPHGALVRWESRSDADLAEAVRVKCANDPGSLSYNEWLRCLFAWGATRA